ncbi:MAG: uroporphyrinogen decarboxylase family protein [Armatimonadota bacterium]
MTPKERFITALELGIPDEVPAFELEFQLAQELLGRDFLPSEDWRGLSQSEREGNIAYTADLHVEIADALEYSAIMVVHPRGDIQSKLDVIKKIDEISGGKYLLLIHDGGTFYIPDGDELEAFCFRIADDPDGVKREADAMVDAAIVRAKTAVENGVQGIAECCDYCFNAGPFLSPDMFAEFVTPYLSRLMAAYRELGLYAIKHTDGDIMPIIDQLVACRPHALHSIDPMAGVDIAEVKRLYGNRICLIGNVNCALMQTGTDVEIVESAEYAMKNGKPGGGYVFSLSNVVYKGIELQKYQMVQEVWKKYRAYAQQ